jgi:hypothetical protein
MANIAEKAGELTTHPVFNGSKSKSGVIYIRTPEITEASKPNKNPPIDTMRVYLRTLLGSICMKKLNF